MDITRNIGVSIYFTRSERLSSPARAVAFVANGFVIAASVIDPWSGYRSAPTITFEGGGGSGAKANSQISA